MKLKSIRRKRGWSQEQLSEISGISVRTIQRIEGGEAPGMESLKALAAAFGQNMEEFQELLETGQDTAKSKGGLLQYGWKGLFIHLGVFMAVISWLLALARFSAFEESFVIWAGFAWAFWIAYHAITLISAKKE
ncbi:MAG: helix-turn-helix domain-containing protein [Alphaproteobacteria bacterium]|nr:helix-turn-helix domain-containing protein [Alphaproteobacteria bacterium]